MSPSSDSALPLHNERTSRSPSPYPEQQAVKAQSPSSVTSTYAFLEPQQVADRLSTSYTNGLSPAEAEIRLHRDGPNELPREEPEPLWLRFLKQFKETLILLLLASAGVSFFMGNFDDAVSITLAVTIVVTVGFVQEYRSEKSLEALNRLVPHYAHLIRDVVPSSGVEYATQGLAINELDPQKPRPESPASISNAVKSSSTVPAAHLVPGDLVLFTTGDRIPADIRITSAADLSIDESNLTGENEPVSKFSEKLNAAKEPSSESPFYGVEGTNVRLSEQHNIAFMGTLVRSGYGQGIVIATGANTEFGRISTSLQEIESPRTPLQLSMDRLGQELSYVSFGVIGLIVVIGLIQGRKLLEMFTIGVSLAVAAIPEGLPIIVTVTLALGVLRMATRGAIMRRLPSVETLGSVNVICSDKTGTLTMSHMTVTKVWHYDCDEPFEIKDGGPPTPEPALQKILRIGNIANNARLSRAHANSPPSASSAAVLSSTLDGSSDHVKSRWVGQPTDVAVLDLLDAFGEDDIRDQLSARVAETPFSSEKKWMGVMIGGAAPGENNMAYIKGALEKVIDRCDTYLTKDGREVILDEPRRKIAREAAERMASEGLRVIAFASGPVREGTRYNRRLGSRSATPSPNIDQSADDEQFNGLVFAGLVGMNDPPRKDVRKSIQRLLTGRVRVMMITGDAETTAVAIARQLGIIVNETPDARAVMRGDQIDHMSTTELSEAIARTTIFARTSPDHKHKIVRALQARGDVVAMTGDGVNDAPALKKADIGIAMGRLGTDVAKEAADMILTDDNFSTILQAIEQGKGIFYNIQNFITFQLSTSVAALGLVLLSTIMGLHNPLNAMQILWINIIMDGPPAQSLGVEPVDPAVMNSPPRPKHARVLTKPLIQRVLTQAALIMFGTLIIYVHEMGDADDELNPGHVSRVVTNHDTTMTFTCFVFFDMFNALTCRSESKSILRGEISLLGNKMFNYAVLGSLVGQLGVIYLPFLQSIFQTEALKFTDLFKLIVLASAVFWIDEARKYYKMLQRRRSPGPMYSHNV
ncbi:Ca2+-transporting ATPase [Talaromyces islandicus]|uniref:P-type Ca(2+) transporter n=1 Tax=Talaromyces islandicus TaxID=28573 RepID=A0A0U1LNB2_TALIS|nr:Ca2+-transporting ATPase [Talaromyces islandicus]